METIIYYTVIIVVVFAFSITVGLAIGPLLRKNGEHYPRAYAVRCASCEAKGVETIVRHTTVPNSHDICEKCKAKQLTIVDGVEWPKQASTN